jgi:NADPH-ferrihemoprotein reductase
MSSTSASDFILALSVTLATAYLFRDHIFTSKSKAAPVAGGAHNKVANGSGNPRDFIATMKEGVRLHVSFLIVLVC